MQNGLRLSRLIPAALLTAGAAFLAPLAAQEAPPSAPAAKMRADRIFVGGPVVTLDPEGTVAGGLAVKDGRILKVGTAQEVRRLAGPGTVVTDLKGRALLPGFIDSHTHFLGVGSTDLYEVDLNSPPIGKVRSIDDIVRLLAERGRSVPEGGTISGRGYDDTLLAEGRHPTRHDLDRASTRHRIVIRHISGHFSAANTKAITDSGITRDTPSPSGGEVRREADGTPLGVFDESAMRLVKAGARPGASRQGRLASAKRASEIYAAQGITTVQNGSTSKPIYEALLDARAKGALPLRLAVLPNQALATASPPPPPPAEAIASGVIIGPVKLFADGSIQGYTGHLTKPYNVPPEGKTDYLGYPSQPCVKLQERVRTNVRRGFQVAIHGNGDAAIDCILDAVENARPETGLFRPVIIHAQMTRADQIQRMKRIGAIPSFFSLHTYYWGDRHLERFLGSARAINISPTRWALDAGVPFAVHSDSPVVPVDSMLMLWATVNRVTTSGKVLGPDQRIPVQAALRAMTINAAYQYGVEKEVGTLETGKLADLVILSQNPLRHAVDLRRIRVIETIVGGKPVFLRGVEDK